MSENETVLTPRQQKLIMALLTPHTMGEAAAVAGVTDATGYRWLKLPHVQEAYKAAQKQVFDDALDELKVGMRETIEALRKHRDAEVEVTAASQMVAIKTWMETSIAVHRSEELEARIAELEETLREIRP